MPDHKYCFQLDQFVRVNDPIVSVCTKDAYECPNSRYCTEESHEVCRVERGPLFKLLEALEMDLTPEITIDGQQWPVLYDLKVEEFEWTPVITGNANQVKSALKEALEEDLDYNVADDTIFDRIGDHWVRRGLDPISMQVGELTASRFSTFMSMQRLESSTSAVSRRSRTSPKKLRRELAARAFLVPGLDPPAAIVELSISESAD
jgi:hypothetical protein